MRVLVLVFVLLSAILAPAAATAQDAAALRREIEQLQKQLQSVTDRLQRLEAQPPAPAQVPPVAAPAPAAAPGLSAIDLARPRQPFGLYQQRGAGQLLFDIGIAGDFVGNLTQKNVEKAQGGTFAGQENRFFPREVELSLFGQIDPYASAVVRIEAGEEARGADTGVHLAEAYVTLLTLPFGTQARLGQVRNRFGYSNEVHEHDLPWVDRPNVMRNFFGGEGLQEKGIEVTLVPDLPFYIEALAGVFNGDNETAFGRTSLQAPLVTLTTEGLYSWRQFNVDVDADGDGVTDSLDKKHRNRWGWYVGGEIQPWRRWAGGLRIDWSQYPENPGAERSFEPYISFWPSEFLRFRAAYKRTDRTHRDGFDLNGGSARTVDEFLLQASFILGAHPAHPF